MNFVNLVSGGLDSTLVGVMARDEGIEHVPLFIDYGQRAAEREWHTCQAVHQDLGLPTPARMDLAGFGKIILSGLTCRDLDVKLDAFTPGRNLIFLLMGAAYAFQLGVPAVAISLLSERTSLFPDQRTSFLTQAEAVFEAALGRPIKVITPLFDLTKGDVIRLAAQRGIAGTYSCHAGSEQPCGRCIACLEFGPAKGA